MAVDPVARPAHCIPEPDLSGLGEFEITARAAVAKLMGELAKKRALVWLFVKDDNDTAVPSHLLSTEANRLAFSLQGDSTTREVVLAARQCTVVSFLDSVKVQFDMALSRREARDEGSLLFGVIPERVHRIQRRSAFRVRPPVGHPGTIVVRNDKGDEESFTIFDMSATGLSFLRPVDGRSFTIGERIALARLELGPRVPVPCTFVIRSIRPLHDDEGHERIGCQFVNLPSEVGRAVAVYVQDAERAMRKLALD